MAPFGPVPVKAAPFLHFASKRPAAGFAGFGANQAVAVAGVASANGVNAASQFGAADAGEYIYSVIGVGPNGLSPMVVAAGLILLHLARDLDKQLQTHCNQMATI